MGTKKKSAESGLKDGSSVHLDLECIEYLEVINNKQAVPSTNQRIVKAALRRMAEEQ